MAAKQRYTYELCVFYGDGSDGYRQSHSTRRLAMGNFEYLRRYRPESVLLLMRQPGETLLAAWHPLLRRVLDKPTLQEQCRAMLGSIPPPGPLYASDLYKQAGGYLTWVLDDNFAGLAGVRSREAR